MHPASEMSLHFYIGNYVILHKLYNIISLLIAVCMHRSLFDACIYYIHACNKHNNYCEILYIITTQCKLPECKCSICASGWMKKYHQRKLQRMNHLVCKWTICASGCRIKHHQRKLQLVTTTICAVEWLHQLKEGKHHKRKVQRSGCKVQRS